jgi:hypothetical protein
MKTNLRWLLLVPMALSGGILACGGGGDRCDPTDPSCSDGGGGGGGGSGGGGGTATITIHNDYADHDIWYVYIWKCEDSPNSTDRLGQEKTLGPDDSIDFTGDPGCYHVRVATGDEPPITKDYERTVAAGESAVIDVPGCVLHCRIE